MKHPTEHDKLIKAEKERHDMKIADLANTSKETETSLGIHKVPWYAES